MRATSLLAAVLLAVVAVTSATSTECPQDNEGDVVHLAHESDCGLFYKCNFGEKLVQTCPNGLKFNAVEQVCDWPESAGCITKIESNSDNIGTTGSDEESDTSDESTEDNDVKDGSDEEVHENDGNDEEELTDSTTSEESNTVPTESDSDESEGSDSATTEAEVIIPTECPATNEGDAVHIAHESNCGLFYKCNHGEKELVVCPSGLAFNPALQVCDWPETVGCVPEVPEEIENSTSTSTEDENESSTTSESATTEEVVIPTECPENNEGDAVHIAHPSDCSLFYKCNHGEKVEHACPGGLEFNAALQVCDWPWSAGCVAQSEEDSESSTTTESNEVSDESDERDEIDEEESTDSTPSEDSSAVPTESDSEETEGSGSATTEAEVIIPTECPENNEDDTVHIAHESNCGQFYKCNHGEKVTFVCPNGLAFNPVLQVCDWPEIVGCVPEVPEEIESSTSATTEDENDESSTTSEPATIEEVVIPTECPASNEGSAVHIAHPTDCSRYYLCNHGSKIEMGCASGLEFNAVAQVCDWPASAGCSVTNVAA